MCFCGNGGSSVGGEGWSKDAGICTVLNLLFYVGHFCFQILLFLCPLYSHIIFQTALKMPKKTPEDVKALVCFISLTTTSKH